MENSNIKCGELVNRPERSFDRYSRVRISKYSNLSEYLNTGNVEGISSITYSNSHLDLMVEDRGFETTVVIFHTALNPDTITTPIFVGQGLLEGLEANVISCSDPVLELGTGLGWFIGIKGANFQNDLAVAIDHAMSTLENHKHLVFYGPSGGGFASLYFSSKFAGSLAMPVNPQTDITAYSAEAVSDYCLTAWGVSGVEAVEATTEVITAYSQKLENHVLYVQNLGDRAHINKQLIPFFEELTVSGRVLLFLGEWGIGHRAPHPDVQRPLLQAAIEVNGEWENLAKHLAVTPYPKAEQMHDMAVQYTLAEKRAIVRRQRNV